MNKRILALSSVLLLALTTALTVMVAAPAAVAQDEAAETEDIIHMLDGRELRGQILEEKKDAIVFKIVDRASGIGGKITILLEEIGEIQRDVPLTSTPDTAKKTKKRAAPTSQPDSEPEETYGARRAATTNLDAPAFYVVPMKGQMGTDVSIDVYKKMVDDIREMEPDYLIIEMECYDSEDRVVNRADRADAGLTGIGILENYKEVTDLFRSELRDVPQVLWIRDSMGASSIIAMSWSDLYMAPDARLGGISHARRFFDISDENVKAKFREAYMALLNGFSSHGGYSFELMHAMVRPEFKLSARWKGRDVEWMLDTSGEYVVDDDEEAGVTFAARDAENFCISQGTVESLDDLALLMGIREYRMAEGEGEEIFEKYREDWRRSLENCKTWWGDYGQYMGWASGEDTLKYLGRAKATVQKILSAMERYKAVEIRVGMELGLRKFDLVTIIEQLKEQIRALRASGRGGGGGGGGSGVGGGGG
jgi:hypothetical protein